MSPDRDHDGGPGTSDEMLPEVYDELRKLARARLSRERRPNQTLQPTALVHEASDPAGRFVAVGLASGSIELRDAATGALVVATGARRCPVTAIAFLADQRVVAAWEDGHVAALTLRAADR
jgi:hypothetical protein